MRTFGLLLLSLPLLLLTATAAPAQSCAGLSPDECWTFRCPAAGTAVTYRGRRDVHLGPAAGDARMCRVAAVPAEQRWLYSLVELSDAAPEALRVWHAGLAPLFPARPGASVSFERPGLDAPQRETFTIVSMGRVATPLGLRQAIIIERSSSGTYRGQPSSYWQHVTLDAETGVRLAVVARGRMGEQEVIAEPVEATAIERAAPR